MDFLSRKLLAREEVAYYCFCYCACGDARHFISYLIGLQIRYATWRNHCIGLSFLHRQDKISVCTHFFLGPSFTRLHRKSAVRSATMTLLMTSSLAGNCTLHLVLLMHIVCHSSLRSYSLAEATARLIQVLCRSNISSENHCYCRLGSQLQQLIDPGPCAAVCGLLPVPSIHQLHCRFRKHPPLRAPVQCALGPADCQPLKASSVLRCILANAKQCSLGASRLSVSLKLPLELGWWLDEVLSLVSHVHSLVFFDRRSDAAIPLAGYLN